MHTYIKIQQLYTITYFAALTCANQAAKLVKLLEYPIF